MLNIIKCFYKECVVLNVLVNSIENVKEVFEVVEGYVLVGVLFKDYFIVEEVVKVMKEYGKEIEEVVLIGLGVGDNC